MKTRVALVVGGTGMLAQLVKSLTGSYDYVGVVGRTDSKLQELANFTKNIIPIKSDYTDLADFEQKLSKFVEDFGKPELVVSWIHSTSPEASYILSNYCVGDFYDVTGSSGREAIHPSRKRETEIKSKDIAYHRVILGSIGNRWLTNQEISEGVYYAVQHNAPEYIVGS